MESHAGSSSLNEPSNGTSPPDLMNDPSYATNTKSRDKPSDEADTCRICRGEGSHEEPLFYPCKCSGSIKFVHQECLMEWLSHSQKKYCELCKTPFRFTKLYHPQMPNRLPTSVFFRRAIIHVFKLLMTWCRGVLVTSVWLILLPWCMRVTWRSLFWVGDGGWARDFYAEHVAKGPQSTATQALDLNAIRSAIDAAQSNISISLALPTFLMPFSQTLNMSAGEPTAWSLVKRFFFGITPSFRDYSHLSGANRSEYNLTVDGAFGNRNPSLLSDIPFFHWFTSPAANRFVIDILEGQIITLLVVIAFILIFLIREWVVQQQPVINMAAMDANNAAANPHDQAAEAGFDEQVDDARQEEVQQDELDAVGVDDAALNDASEEESEDDEEEQGPSRRRPTAWNFTDELPHELRVAMSRGGIEEMARVIEAMPAEEAKRVKEQLTKISDNMRHARGEPSSSSESAASSSRKRTESVSDSANLENPETQSTSSQSKYYEQAQPEDPDNPVSPQRPNMPARGRSFLATEIRRSLEEGDSWPFPPLESQETVEGEVKKEAMPDSWDDEDPDDSAQKLDSEQGSDHSSESWQQVPEGIPNDALEIPVEQPLKGKEKAEVADATSSEQEPQVASTTILDCSTPDQDNLDLKPTDNTAGNEPVSVPEHTPTPNSSLERDAQPQGQAARDIVQRQPSFAERVVDWLWGDVAPAVPQTGDDDANDEHIVQNLADEAPFVPFGGNGPREPANPPVQDAEVAAAAAQAGIDLNDQDAIDDAEDLEGILELIGMQGPITGLFQNAMFSAVLISATLACAVWFPYLWGKVVLLLMGSPISLFIKLPLRFIASFADLVIDSALCLGAGAVFWVIQIVRWTTSPITLWFLSDAVEKLGDMVATPARTVAENAMDRIAKLFLESTALPSPSYLRLSVNSHAALRTIQNTTSEALSYTGNTVISWCGNITSLNATEAPVTLIRQIPAALRYMTDIIISTTQHAASFIWKSNYKITLDLGQDVTSTYTTIEQWSATDRLIAIFAGYAFFAVAGALYLKRAAPITTSQQGRKVEGIISDILQQAGGVLKVILIISIEMLAFPLYCGLLLDVALLPLFENATLYSRYQFTLRAPWTSGFVHWFVGTCYMFHFALFVSMCRKIMRSGVLYFIRDPDDPTFHPVRDVLERNVTTQLRKIAFSALVYGGLVIICLGGVVWSLDRSVDTVLPIHWASQTPSLEFPLDLLFYNFLTPLVIRVYKPSDGLHKMYQWWFKSCARVLRLSNFLFGEKAKDEEGHHVRRTWSSWFAGEKGDAEKPVVGEDRKLLADDRGTKVYFLFDGKYVRAPASDQVRIPKGESVFVEVDQFNQRKDGKPEEGGVHSRNSDMVTMVYIPPWFRMRIALFVLTIWFFAAATGVGITVVPLLFGRYMFSTFLPSSVQMNDIHAFSLGIYTLGGIIYSALHLRPLFSNLRGPLSNPLAILRSLATTTSNFALRVLRIGYVYTSLVLLIPILFALLLELYILIPLHAYLGPHEPHVVHLIQDWTLGFLYARLAARLLFSDRNSRPARAFNAVIADGYTNPNAKLATRCFILPVLFFFGLAILVPSAAAFTLNRTLWLSAIEPTKSQVWRFSYPVVALLLACVWAVREGVGMISRWRMIVRDEVYLIGERLHNFGEKRPGPAIRRVSHRS